MKIINYNFNVDREELIRPFKFKGGQFTEKWITITTVESKKGYKSTGIGGLAILWSDPDVFSANSETGGNIIMSAIAEYALKLIKDKEFITPIEALESIFNPLHKYGQKITNNKKLKKSFTLNSLVSLDNALWKIYALENNIKNFYDLIPHQYKEAFLNHQKQLVCIPSITYNLPLNQINELVKNGHFFLKIKIGQSGSQKDMLGKDKKRILEIYEATKSEKTEYTNNGKILYYLDANGRYLKKETLQKLLEYADKIKMLEQISILEEPFPKKAEIDVFDLPVRISADESLSSVDDVNNKIDLGYQAITLKPAGKTLSMSLKMGYTAYKRNVLYYVADSLCVPILLDWNKNVAVRLNNFPGIKMGIIESNGPQFYKNWKKLLKDHPYYNAEWLEPKNGIFYINNNFYETSGGIFSEPKN